MKHHPHLFLCNKYLFILFVYLSEKSSVKVKKEKEKSRSRPRSLSSDRRRVFHRSPQGHKGQYFIFSISVISFLIIYSEYNPSKFSYFVCCPIISEQFLCHGSNIENICHNDLSRMGHGNDIKWTVMVFLFLCVFMTTCNTGDYTILLLTLYWQHLNQLLQ